MLNSPPVLLREEGGRGEKEWWGGGGGEKERTGMKEQEQTPRGLPQKQSRRGQSRGQLGKQGGW